MCDAYGGNHRRQNAKGLGRRLAGTAAVGLVLFGAMVGEAAAQVRGGGPVFSAPPPPPPAMIHGGFGGAIGATSSGGFGGFGSSSSTQTQTQTGSAATAAANPGRPSQVRPKRKTGNVDTATAHHGYLPAAGERRYVANEVVIEAAGRLTEPQVAALAARFRLDRVESRTMDLTNSTYFRWRIRDNRSVSDVIREIANDRSANNPVVTVQPNYRYSLQQAATGEGDPAQYALTKLRLPEAHGLATGDKVLVAVIDSGIDVTHPELNSAIEATFDAVHGTEGPHPHGTAVAGIIAAHARLMGAAPSVRILAARAFSSTEGSTFSIITSLDWAIGKKARVINMSFAGPSDPALARAIASARRSGAVLIAAVGNAGPKSPPLYPAADPDVIGVTATDSEDHLFAQSNRGSYVAVAAPGVDILAPAPDAAYQTSSGTSFAAAYVSGTVALMLERRPDLTADAVKQGLIASARDLGRRGRDDQFGAGLIDAMRAVQAITPPAGPVAAGPSR